MVTNQLIDYIKSQLQNGADAEQIKGALMAGGWQAKDIEDAFKSIDPSKFSNIRSAIQQSQNAQKDFSISKKINSKLIAVIVIAGVIIAGGAAFGYYIYFRPLSPAEVMAKTLNNLSGIKSFSYSLEAQSVVTQSVTQNPFGQPQPAVNQTANININASGTADISDLNNIKLELNLNPLINISSQGMSFSPNLDLIKISNVIYLMVNNIPSFGFLPVSSFENKWIEIDLTKINQEFKNSPLGQIQDQINQQLGQASSSQIQISQAQINSIKEAVLNSGAFEFSQALPDENIGGSDFYHYQFVLNRDKFVDLIVKIGQIVKNNQPLSQEDLKNIQNSKDSLDNNLILNPIDIWISKKDFLPYRIGVEGSSLNTAIATGSVLSVSTSTALLNFSNFNQPENITPPSQAEPIENLIQSIMGNNLPTINSGNNVGLNAGSVNHVNTFIYLSKDQTLSDAVSNLKFQVLTIASDNIEVLVTNPKTNRAQMITLTLHDKTATAVFGYKISLISMNEKTGQAILQVTN
ncbi:MAG: hypothetical protein M1334_03190 [Patescibacteria group bacterium]|nr:hypothetical protein [Patescibacteria group bacterium]